MNLWLKIILLLFGILIFTVPAVNYWSKIYKEKRFKSGIELFVYTILQGFFSCFVICLVYFLYQFDTDSRSLVPIFILSHALLFVTLTAVLPATYGLKLITNRVGKFFLHTKFVVRIYKYIMKFSFFRTFYNSETEIILDILSGTFIKRFMVGSYLTCGIITASGISNSLIILLCRQPDIAKHFSEFSTVYSNDLKLYTDIFLMSALSFALSRIKTKSR